MQRSLLAVKEFLLSTNYEELFRFLPSEPLLHLEKSTGRPPYPRTALLKALIYMGLRRIDTLTELVFHLREHPSLSEACGFDLMSPPPEVERFSSFLRDTDHQLLVNVRNLLVKGLIQLDQITGKVLSMDSCPLVSPLKENNLKTTVKARYDKERRPKGDPHARLG